MNLAALRKGVLAEANRLGASIPSNLVLNYALNTAGEEFVRDSRIARATRTFNVVAAQAAYTLTGDILDVYRAYHDNIPLMRVAQEDLDGEILRWKTQTGSPSHYYMTGADTFNAWPTPGAALASGFKVDVAVAWATDMSADADDPKTINQIPSKYHRALTWRAASELFGDKALMARYERALHDCKTDVERSFGVGEPVAPYRYL